MTIYITSATMKAAIIITSYQNQLQSKNKLFMGILNLKIPVITTELTRQRAKVIQTLQLRFS